MPAAKKPDRPQKMDFDEFILWAEEQEGHWELHDGVPVRLHDPARLHSERAGHIRVKHKIANIFEKAIGNKERDCEVLADGATVRIDKNISYDPDAVVYSGSRMGNDDIVVPDPVIVVEVLSPSTAWRDVGEKLADYFRLSSVAHYLIIDPDNRHVMHHYRDGEVVSAEAVNRDHLSLDPPGLRLDLAELFV